MARSISTLGKRTALAFAIGASLLIGGAGHPSALALPAPGQATSAGTGCLCGPITHGDPFIYTNILGSSLPLSAPNNGQNPLDFLHELQTGNLHGTIEITSPSDVIAVIFGY